MGESEQAEAVRALLGERGAHGHWEGGLSSSALSTATAVVALALWERELDATPLAREPANGLFAANEVERRRDAIAAGLRWLAEHQNADGGWGDTTRSFSNISTTALGWAAFGAVPGADAQFSNAVTRAREWLRAKAGGLGAAKLAAAITARYGKDQTFSVPILTMCVLAGRFGAGREAWRWVSQLPFELAAFPQKLFAALRLPVVSYALPALITMGQARHCHRPTRNPVTRLLRDATRARTLRVLGGIQPASGGFLEATPLTSFVTMSLAGAGNAHHPVALRAVGFLLASRRPDGSWPIDTNLATWVTTLSVNALAGSGSLPLDDAARNQILDWLLDQHYQEVHPYTNAPPGGWAWTDLSGGVPDADDTPGALIALHHLARGLRDAERQERVRRAARLGVDWLLGLQNGDGGIPTFCRGWTNLPFDRSSPDLTAHTLRAWELWRRELPEPARERVREAMDDGLQFLAGTQRADGAWIPLWFGNQHTTDDENPTYGTARVLAALNALGAAEFPCLRTLRPRAAAWLARAQCADGGWSGGGEWPASVEETALAVEALAGFAGDDAAITGAVARGAEWLSARVRNGSWREPSPIGFYFAKLWYHEKLYPLIFTVGALNAVRTRDTTGDAAR